MRIQYNGKSKILIRLTELVNQKADAEDMEQTAADLQKEIDEKADKSAIPTVGDGVLSVQRNGKSVGTFSANAAGNASINIPVPEKVSELENDAGYGTYTKPTTGIPKSDLASGVQASLGKADTALQKHQDISGKLDKTGDASNTTVAFSAASARENVKTGEKLSVIIGKIAKWFADLKTVAFTGSYNDLANKPTIPDISGKQDKLTAGTNITISGNTISAKDTTYTSKSAVSGGTDVSLVTTGEKAIWNAKTSNVGTITGIKMNGASKGTSGVVDLGTVITAHQDISGKQDKSTAVTHTANTAVGSMAKPVYIAADGKATPITHSVNSDVPSNAKFTDTVYTHPTTAGNKHIPAGGSSGQILRWSADGTAAWGADNNTTYNDATQSTHGLMTAADKKKLDGMDLTKYLPLSGGVMTGAIDTVTNGVDITVSPNRSNNSNPTLVAGGSYEAPGIATNTLKSYKSLIGTYQNTKTGTWFNMISVRHRNGYGDGVNYGMYLYSGLTYGGDLIWNKQTAINTWQGERTLLDSVNYTSYALAKDGTAKKAELLSSGQMRTVYCHNDDSTFSNGHVWFKIGTAILSGGYDTCTTTFLGICGYGKHALYTARIRLTSAGNAVESISFLESGRTGGMLTGLFRIVAINGKENVTFELWAKGASRWEGTRVVILNEMRLDGSNRSNIWTLTSRGNADAKTAPTSGNMFVDSSDSSICATATNASNSTTWHGLIDDTQTKNSADSWLLVKTGNKIQHRLSHELVVKEATTLTDSGWIDTTRDTTVTVTSTVKCRKYGQLVEVRGEVTFNSTYGSPTVCTLPAGYRPAEVVQACGITPNGKQYMIKADTSGVISFGSDSGSTFVKGTTYRVDLTYLLG